MAEPRPGSVIAGKYRVVKRLSHGGMGSVWLAEHMHLDAPVAVKFMRPSLVADASARSRFEREAKAAAQIRSPHVVHVYDHGVDDDTPFIVMEYLEGDDLRARLKGRKRLPPPEVVRICHEVCKGLHRAHRLGIVHRDLKPGNIFLSVPDDDMVKILDFGIAKETGENRVVRGETTTTGQLLGSPHYLSPEQARGKPLDGRSDLWSLAVILFRALTGRRPFDGDDIGDLIVRICTDPVPQVSQLCPELGVELDAFFDRAFQRVPDERFQGAKEMSTAFAAALQMLTRRNPEDSSRWSRISVGPPGDVDPEAPTTYHTPHSQPSGPSLGSSRFGNMAVGGMTPDEEGELPTHTPHPDTFAATYGPSQTKRRAVVGGVLGAGALLAVVIVALAFGAPDPETGASPAAGPGLDQTPQHETAVATDTVAAPAVDEEPEVRPDEDTPADEAVQDKPNDSDQDEDKDEAKEDNPAPKPVVRRPRPRHRPRVDPKPKPTPKPKSKGVDLGY